jgi:hypothetical protein
MKRGRLFSEEKGEHRGGRFRSMGRIPQQAAPLHCISRIKTNCEQTAVENVYTRLPLCSPLAAVGRVEGSKKGMRPKWVVTKSRRAKVTTISAAAFHCAYQAHTKEEREWIT